MPQLGWWLRWVPTSGHWVGRVSGLHRVLGTAAGLGGLVRSVPPHSEPMVTAQRLLRSDVPFLGWEVPQPPNSAPGPSVWAINVQRRQTWGPLREDHLEVCCCGGRTSRGQQPLRRVSLQDCDLEKGREVKSCLHCPHPPPPQSVCSGSSISGLKAKNT